MTAGSRALIIIPAFNEAETIASVIAQAKKQAQVCDILVVDDGSTDSTRRIAESLGVPVCSLPFNLGVGGAMRLGFRFAVENGYETAIQVDADGQHDPAEIPKLLQALSGTDIVIGARFAGQGEYEVSFLRGVAMRLLSVGISSVVGTQLTDTTSGFKAVGPRALAFFSREFPAEYLGDTIEALVSASRAGLSIVQVPVVMRPRSGGVPSQRSHKALLHLLRASFALLVSILRKPVMQFEVNK